jgi:hypothetical protein
MRLDPFDWQKLSCGSPVSLDADQFDQAKPIQPASKSRNLAVMSKWRIDKTRRPDERTHYCL